MLKKTLGLHYFMASIIKLDLLHSWDYGKFWQDLKDFQVT
jgi:hypothetical protein